MSTVIAPTGSVAPVASGVCTVMYDMHVVCCSRFHVIAGETSPCTETS